MVFLLIKPKKTLHCLVHRTSHANGSKVPNPMMLEEEFKGKVEVKETDFKFGKDSWMLTELLQAEQSIGLSSSSKTFAVSPSSNKSDPDSFKHCQTTEITNKHQKLYSKFRYSVKGNGSPINKKTDTNKR